MENPRSLQQWLNKLRRWLCCSCDGLALTTDRQLPSQAGGLQRSQAEPCS